MKHNKKRNVGLVYEALTRELTKSILSKKGRRQQVIISILKECFKSNSLLKKELDLYREIRKDDTLSKEQAGKVLLEVKRQYSSIDKDELFKEQSKLISKINKALSKDVYNNFVSDYKFKASLYQYLNDMGSAKERVLLEEKVVDYMMDNVEEAQQPKIDNLTFKTFVGKYNDEYNNFLSEQKELLTKYIEKGSSDLEFKDYINETIGKLKSGLEESIKKPVISEDEVMVGKAMEVKALLESFSKKPIDEKMLAVVMEVQRLISEINSND